MAAIRLRKVEDDDRTWVAAVHEEQWYSSEIVSRGAVHQVGRLPGFIAEVQGEPVGVVTYCTDGNECELVSLLSLREGVGVGSALLGAIREAAHTAACRRIWLVTTNDNIEALRFYQKRGWRLVAIHRDALDESRRLKPEIPLRGIDDIPLRDEIEFEIVL